MQVNPDYSVLLVDDDEELRHILGRTLEKRDLLVQQARDGEAASEMLQKREYDALITDLRMPRKHGFQLINEVLEMKPRPLIFVVTGIVEPNLAHDLCVRGVESLDLKPLHMKEFAGKVRGMLEYRATRRMTSTTVGDGFDQTADAINAQLESVTDSFESAIQRLRQQKSELEKGFVGSVRMLSGLFGASENSEGVHGHRVETMAAFIGKRVGLNSQELRDLRLSALLHEIGQFSMPDRIKQSAPWQLRQEDREQYEKYPAIGATLISEIPGTDGIVPLIEAHCENYNGSGFPKRLEENQIPLGARILRIADGYDTFCMYSEENQPEEAAKKYLADKRGKIHDPELFKHAIAYVEDALARRKDQRTTTIAAQELVESHMLAENLYDDDGRFLAAQGTEISRRLAEHLAELLGGRDVLVYEQMPDDSPNT